MKACISFGGFHWLESFGVFHLVESFCIIRQLAFIGWSNSLAGGISFGGVGILAFIGWMAFWLS